MKSEEATVAKSQYLSPVKPGEAESYATYAIIMLKLQELCGMTYKEARAYLMAYKESGENLAEDLGISIQSVRNIYRRAALKIECSGFSLYDIMNIYGKLPFIDF